MGDALLELERHVLDPRLNLKIVRGGCTRPNRGTIARSLGRGGMRTSAFRTQRVPQCLTLSPCRMPPRWPSETGRIHQREIVFRVSAAGHESATTGGDSPLHALVAWVEAEGGFLHPSIQPVEAAPCGGGRGLVCTEGDLGLEEVQGTPLILLPEVRQGEGLTDVAA